MKVLGNKRVFCPVARSLEYHGVAHIPKSINMTKINSVYFTEKSNLVSFNQIEKNSAKLFHFIIPSFNSTETHYLQH